MEKDHVNLETVYAQSIQHTFTEKAEIPDIAGVIKSEKAEQVIHDKMEQIEHVIEEMHVGGGGIVEEEDIDDEHVVIDQDSDYDDIEEEEEEEEVHVINPNVNVSWFGDEEEDHESYAEQKDLFDLDANFVNIHHDEHPHYPHQHQQVNDQPANEPNEWELIN